MNALFNEIRDLRNQLAAVALENKELRDRLDKQEWFHSEFRSIMLDRLAAAEGH